MSETGATEQSPEQIENIRACAADWLARRDRGDWSDADQAALDAWLSQSWAHTTAYWRLEAAWNRAGRLGALRDQKLDGALAERTQFLPILLRSAAVLVAVAVLGAGAMYFFAAKQTDRSYSTDIGGRELVTFEDGSKIELNTSTAVRVRMTTSQRIVWLDQGEAYFDVKHDAAHPFVVFADGRRITDLGTQFLVRRYPRTLEVALLQGRVRMGTQDERAQSPSRLLAPGDVAIATAGSMAITKKPVQEIANELAWRRGVLVFDNATLADVVAEINRYNRQKLVIADADAGELKIVGTFRTDDVQGFTDIVRAVFKLHVRNNGTEIVISR